MWAVVPTADAITAFSALVNYERQIVPLVRGELGRWRARAATIPDPILRAAALSALREKGQNVEVIGRLRDPGTAGRSSRGAAGDGGTAGRD